MIDESTAFIPIWMLLSAAFGFLIGDAFGDSTRHRNCLEQANEDLREQVRKAQPCEPKLQRELHQQRRVINDIHKRVIAVTQGLEKAAL